jgi:hypothetical protein
LKRGGDETTDGRDKEVACEAFKRFWPPLIKMDEVVKTKAEK